MHRAILAGAFALALQSTGIPGQEVRIINLFDAFGEERPGTRFDWGFSAYLEYGDRVLLFDAGNDPDLLRQNAQALGVDLRRVEIAVLSHRHADHASGLDYLLRVNPKVKLYLPRDSRLGAPYRFTFPAGETEAAQSLPTRQRYFRGEKEEILYDPGDRFWRADLEFLDGHRQIAPGVHLIATESPDQQIPELSLALVQGDRIVLLTGCSHSKLDTIVSAARNHAKKDIRLLMGGYHLAWEADGYIEEIVRKLQGQLGVQQVAPAHCTGHRAVKALKKLFGDDFLHAGLGARLDLPTQGSHAQGSAYLSEGVPAGRWKATATTSNGQAFHYWLNLGVIAEQPVGTIDLFYDEAKKIAFRGGFLDAPTQELTLESQALSWSFPAPLRNLRCQVVLTAPDILQGTCLQGDSAIRVVLVPDPSDPWLADSFAAEGSSPAENRFTGAAAAVIRALAARDQPLFESLFAPTTRGTEPTELWNSAWGAFPKPPYALTALMNGILRGESGESAGGIDSLLQNRSRGKATRITFSEQDGDGAFVRLHFDQGHQEFFVALDNQERILEFTYVPPPGGAYRLKR